MRASAIDIDHLVFDAFRPRAIHPVRGGRGPSSGFLFHCFNVSPRCTSTVKSPTFSAIRVRFDDMQNISHQRRITQLQQLVTGISIEADHRHGLQQQQHRVGRYNQQRGAAFVCQATEERSMLHQCCKRLGTWRIKGLGGQKASPLLVCPCPLLPSRYLLIDRPRRMKNRGTAESSTSQTLG